jgi:hypothetical protein
MSFISNGVGHLRKLVWTWTSDASGDASEASVFKMTGKILGLATIPDGTAVPTDNYDVTILDSDGHDVLLGAGANRDIATTEYVSETSLAAVVNSKLTLTVAAAGASKKGTVILYVREER